MVEFFNFYYIFYIVAAVSLVASLYFAFRKNSDKTKFWIVFGLVALNFALHFIKLGFEPYISNPNRLRKISAENICAISTLIFPLLILSKRGWGRDYMFYIGGLGGIMAFLVPTEALGREAFVFESIRFYLCHFILIAAPLLMVMWGLHKLDYRRIWQVPFMFLACMGLILINEVLLLAVGLTEGDLMTLLSRNTRNNSFVFGPTDSFYDAAKPLLFFVPDFFVRELNGETIYIPILWAFFPATIYLNVIFFMMSMPFEAKHFGSDMAKLAKLMRKKERA